MGWRDAPVVELDRTPAWARAPLLDEELPPLPSRGLRRQPPEQRQEETQQPALSPQQQSASAPPPPAKRKVKFRGAIYNFPADFNDEQVGKWFEQNVAQAQPVPRSPEMRLRDTWEQGGAAVSPHSAAAQPQTTGTAPPAVMPQGPRPIRAPSPIPQEVINKQWGQPVVSGQQAAVKPAPAAQELNVANDPDREIRMLDAAEKIAERLSSTASFGLGEHMFAANVPPDMRPFVLDAIRRRYSADQTMKKAGYMARAATSAVEGALDFAKPFAKMAGALPSLDPDQERFRQEMLAVRQEVDPTVRPDTPTLGRWTQQAAQMTFPMVQSIGAGRAAGGAAGLLGAGAKATAGAVALGTSGSFLPQIADDTYTQLIGEGVNPSDAKLVTAIAAPVEAAVESFLPDPFKGMSGALRGTARQVAKKVAAEALKRYGKELSEEIIQGGVREVGSIVASRMDEMVPDKGLGSVFSKSLEAGIESAGPLAIMMAPGGARLGMEGVATRSRKTRLDQLKAVRAKGSVSRTDAKNLGLPPEASTNQTTRKTAVEEEIKQLEQEIQDAESVASGVSTESGGGASAGAVGSVPRQPSLPVTDQQGDTTDVQTPSQTGTPVVESATGSNVTPGTTQQASGQQTGSEGGVANVESEQDEQAVSQGKIVVYTATNAPSLAEIKPQPFFTHDRPVVFASNSREHAEYWAKKNGGNVYKAYLDPGKIVEVGEFNNDAESLNGIEYDTAVSRGIKDAGFTIDEYVIHDSSRLQSTTPTEDAAVPPAVEEQAQEQPAGPAGGDLTAEQIASAKKVLDDTLWLVETLEEERDLDVLEVATQLGVDLATAGKLYDAVRGTTPAAPASPPVPPSPIPPQNPPAAPEAAGGATAGSQVDLAQEQAFLDDLDSQSAPPQTVEPSVEPQPPAEKPADKPGRGKRPKSIWNAVGKNVAGQAVLEDQNGVRAYVEVGVTGTGIRVTEPVAMVPSKGGNRPSVNVSTRGDEFKTVEEMQTPKPTPATTPPSPGPLIVKPIFGGGPATVIPERPSGQENPAETPTPDYGTIDAPSRTALSRHFEQQLASGKSYPTIREARQEAGKLLKGDVKAGTRIVKDVDEAVEIGVVRALRTVLADKPDAQGKYDAALDLHQRQPTLGSRTSTSVAQQAYSTPAPLAVLASTLADVNKDAAAYDATAGNGMLLADANPDLAVANELNAERAAAIRDQGIETTENDATQYAPEDGTIDSIILNPPFGHVKERPEGSVNIQTKEWYIDGVRTKEVDHAIVMNSLPAMKEGGKAALILGAKGDKAKTDIEKRQAYLAPSSAQFYKWLYDNYNVVGHITVNGDLYSKQGASFPVDLIWIEGRGKATRPYPWAAAPKQYNTWEELGDVLRTRTDPMVESSGVTQPGRGGRPDKAGGKATDVGPVRRQAGEPGPADAGGTVPGREGSKAGVQPSVAGEVRPGTVVERPAVPPDEPRLRGQTGRPGRGTERLPAETGEAGTGRGRPAGEPGTVERPGGLAGGTVGTGRESGLSLDEMSEDDLADALAADAMQHFGWQDAAVEEKPKEEVTPESKAADQPPKERKPSTGKKEAKEQPTKQPQSPADKKAQGKAELDAALKEFGDIAKGTLWQNPMFNPEVIRAAAKVAAKLVKYEYYNFADYVNTMAETFGRDKTLGIAPLLEYVWSKIHSMDKSGKVSPAGSTAAVLGQDQQPNQDERDPNIEYQVKWQPRSKHGSLDTMVPANLETPMREALDDLEGRIGDIDKYVGDKLGYTEKELESYFGAEQIDAIALAIDNHERGRGFILGDQTGVGKGRVVAAMIRYARRQNLVPVFVTQKASLYADIMRDLISIGESTDEKPFNLLPTNSLTGNDKVILPDGRELSQGGAAAQRKVTDFVDAVLAGNKAEVKDRRGAKTATEYHALATTYSQLQPLGKSGRGAGATSIPSWRNAIMEQVAPRAFFILDESHEAGGQATDDLNARQAKNANQWSRSDAVRTILRNAAGGMYSSATFAKRPSVMDLYFLTDMKLATDGNLEAMKAAIVHGGIPMQQVVSTMLARAGQYVRRERSFEGIDFPTRIVDVDMKKADDVSTSFRLINQFSQAKEEGVAAVQDDVLASGGTITADSSTGRYGVDSFNFSSILWNLVDQMILSMKAEAVAQEAIASVRRGQKVVIGLQNTMESSLRRYVEQEGLRNGDEVDMDFGTLLMRYLERTREVKIKDRLTPDAPAETHYLTDEELGPEGLAAYNRAKDWIEKMDVSGMAVSPIDWIRHRIEAAGIRTGEVTGRQHVIEYQDDGTAKLAVREAGERGVRGAIASVNDFNNADLDVAIVNASGATGISMHSDRKFTRQEQRHMILAQGPANIDTFMQLLGRINRTNQATLPTYTLFLTSLPAENRPAAVLLKKLSSLNANVTGDSKGVVDLDVPDLINRVGDDVVSMYFDQERGDYADIDSPELWEEDVAKKASGRMALLPVERQQHFWDWVSGTFKNTVEELDERHENPLRTKVMPLDAKTIESFDLFAGDKDSTSPFSQPAAIEQIDAKQLRKPMKPEEVQEQLLKFYDAGGLAQIPRMRREWLQTTLSELDEKIDAAIAKRTAGMADDKASQAIMELNAVRNKLHTMISDMAPGTIGAYVVGGYQAPAMVLKVGLPGNRDSWTAMSNYDFTVAVADSARTARYNFTVADRRGNGEDQDMDRFVVGSSEPTIYGLESTLEEFAQVVMSGREKRYVATGNLLAAASQLRNGRISLFTDSEGNVRQGILMPQRFDPVEWVKDRPVVFTERDKAMQFLNQGGFLFTPDGNFQVSIQRDVLAMRAKKSKAQGGRYYLNDKILAAAAPEEFTTTGNWMVAVIHGKSRFNPIVDAILGQFSLQAVMDKDLARRIMGIELPGAKKPETNKGLKRRIGAAKTGPTGRDAITKEVVQGVFPGSNITRAANGWHVETGDSFFTIEFTPEIEVDEATRRRMEKGVPASLRDKIGVAGSFSVTLPDGTRHTGLGLMRLAEQLADSSTVRHEAVHLARGIGLFGEYEWQALVDAHAQGAVDEAQQEELIAIAHEAVEADAGVWSRITRWIRQLLAKIGIGRYDAADVHQLMYETGFWMRPTTRTETNGTRYQFRDPRTAFRTRHDLANVGETQRARELVDEVDAARNESMLPERRADEDVQREADERLKQDYDGERAKLLRAGQTGGQLNDVETLMAKAVFNREADKAFRTGKPEDLTDAMAFMEAYRNTGSEQGRAFRQRFDPIESPAERFARALSESLLELPEKDRGERDEARRKGDNKKADAINAAWAKKFADLKAKLKALGVDLDNLWKHGYDKHKATEAARIIQTVKADGYDKMYEYWRNSILSGVTTQAANVIGNFANAGWHFTAERMTEAVLNVAMRRGEGAQLGEFKYILGGILPGLSRGARNFLTTWRTEMPELESQIGRNQISKLESSGMHFAIGGKKGRVIRMPQRLLLAVDDFAKSMFVEMEVGARAYRIAKEEGKTGDNLRIRIAQLTADLESPAWDQAYDSALELTFQQEGGETLQKIKRNVLSARRDIPGLRYLIPFVVTPINIFSEGLSKSPLGTFSIAQRMYENYKQGDPAFKGLSGDVAQKVIAWAVTLALMGLLDDDEPWITGTEPAMTRSGREVSYRTKPAMSFRVGDSWYSYSRIEPFATALGLTVDWLTALRSGDAEKTIKVPFNSMIGQIRDKTFLSGVGDIIEAIELDDPINSLAKWGSNFTTSWVPNLVRTGIRESDSDVQQTRVWGKGTDLYGMIGKRTGQKAGLPLGPTYPIYDVWGRSAKRSDVPGPVATDWLYRTTVPIRVQKDETFVADRLLINWNNQNSEDVSLPRSPMPRYTVDGQTKYMTDAQYADFTRLAGETSRFALEQFKLNAEKPTAGQVELIGDVVEKARETVKELLVKQWGDKDGKDLKLDAKALGVKIHDETVKALRDLRRGEGRPDRKAAAKTPYKDRLAAWQAEKAAAVDTLKSLGK